MKDLEPVFYASGDDWVRYSAGSWIVWTEKTAAEWYLIVKPHIAVYEYVLIAELNMNERFGWQPKYIWDWIDSKRGIQHDNELAKLLGGYLSDPTE